jgi:hypothetical protein
MIGNHHHPVLSKLHKIHSGVTNLRSRALQQQLTLIQNSSFWMHPWLVKPQLLWWLLNMCKLIKAGIHQYNDYLTIANRQHHPIQCFPKPHKIQGLRIHGPCLILTGNDEHKFALTSWAQALQQLLTLIQTFSFCRHPRLVKPPWLLRWLKHMCKADQYRHPHTD